MNYSIVIFISLILLSSSCVKEDGKISSGSVDSGGSTTGGSTEIPGAPDPLAAQAWHLENEGQATFSSGVGVAGEDISLTEAVALGYTGEGVRIAVSDTGTDIDHEDLTGTQLVGEHRNYAISNPNLWRTTLPYYVDNDAHGTAVVGLIAAEAYNGIGSRGVAPGAKYAAFRFIGDYTADDASYIVRNIDQAEGDFDIFNYSYGYSQCEYTEVDDLILSAFQDGVASLRGYLGAIYIQSAGNSYIDYDNSCVGNTNTSNDLTTPYKIIVGAINASGIKSSYSSPGSGIWVSAPGGEYGTTEPAMLTTDISGCAHGYSVTSYALNEFNRGSSLNSECSYTSRMNGTSSAAPVLSGVVALMLQANPSLTWRDVKHILATTADLPLDMIISGLYLNAGTSTSMWVSDELSHPLNDPTATIPVSYDPAGYVYDWLWITNNVGINYSNWYGFGRVNANEAVVAALGYIPGSLGAYVETEYLSAPALGLVIPETPAALSPDGTISTISAGSFVIESVQIEINISHASPSDVGISLISPSGTESRILHYNSFVTETAFPSGKILLTNAFYGEDSSGNWTIKVTDAKAGTTGTLNSWKVKINGHVP